MYWGSVKFFKHLILLFIFGSLAIAIVLAVFWGVKYHRVSADRQQAQHEIDLMQLENNEFMSALAALKKGSPEEFLAICQENGVSAKDVLDALQKAQSSQTGKASAFAEQPAADGSTTKALPSYAASYPDLHVTPPIQAASPTKPTVYLTFDNGPTPTTDRILAILGRYHVKATFFVSPALDGSDTSRLRRIHDAGHALALRPTEKGKIVYTDVQSFLKDFAAASDLLYKATGVKANMLRFPGGSINDYNKSISPALISEMQRRGYVYFDWNVDCGQTAAANTNGNAISNKIMQAAQNNNSTVVLLYDDWNCNATVDSLARTIETLEQRGYAFDRLTNSVKPIVFNAQSTPATAP